MLLCDVDMLPAISFAYEHSETDIMQRPPRDRKKDKLVTAQLISFSYLQIGMIQTVAAFTAFFFVFHRVGHFSFLSLVRARQGVDWLVNDDDDTDDSDCTFENDDGQCVYFEERRDILRQAQTAYLAAIVITQVGDAIACKTRLNSIVRHGFGNMVLNFGFLEESTLIALLVYVPFLNFVFGTRPTQAMDWLIVLPFAAGIVLYDEIRKLLLRVLGDESSFYKMVYY
jgi:sodium/potassium-transporting ATPase subunit alpha